MKREQVFASSCQIDPVGAHDSRQAYYCPGLHVGRGHPCEEPFTRVQRRSDTPIGSINRTARSSIVRDVDVGPGFNVHQRNEANRVGIRAGLNESKVAGIELGLLRVDEVSASQCEDCGDEDSGTRIHE